MSCSLCYHHHEILGQRGLGLLLLHLHVHLHLLCSCLLRLSEAEDLMVQVVVFTVELDIMC